MDKVAAHRRAVLSTLAAWLTLGCAPAALAQAYPQRPVRVVVPYVVGGSLDITARMFAQALSEELGQPFIVENRPGANGNLGTEQVVRSAPDGYTLAMLAAGTMTINPALYRNMPFDPEKDLAPISQVAAGPMVLTINPALPFKSLAELIAHARANPGKLNFGSGGNGSLAHLSTEMLKLRTGVDIVHVPYKGTALATNDLMAGHIQAMFDTLATAVPLIREGKMRALAVTSAKRSTVFPELPTVAEVGVNDYAAETWAGLVAPAGTPVQVVSRLQAAVAKISADPRIRTRLAVVGSEAVGGTSEQFASVVRTERARWAEVVKVSGARLD
jgi:tripartite-type tricarboxylate transporter receptor subunit TctC